MEQMSKSLAEVIAIVNGDTAEKILASIPYEKLRDIPDELCRLLINNDLSFQQAELLLEVAKGRLRRARI